MSYDGLVAKAAIYRGEDPCQHTWLEAPEFGDEDLEICTTCGAEQR